MKDELYAGMDLHSNNVVVAIVDKHGKRLGHRKLPCQLAAVLDHLAKAPGELVAVAVESTFNWYWLVDGLMDAGYPMSLANPAGMEQYSGLKCANDTTDAYFIAELLRLGILETGYIYDRQSRGVRDLLRRRQLLVSKRTALILSLKNQYIRTHGQTMALGQVKTTPPQEISALFSDHHDGLAAQITKEQIEHLDHAINRMEKECWRAARSFDNYPALRSLPGVGPVLAGTIALEVGDIQRFKSPGDFASYCRTVAAKKYSNNKKKGDNNRKCGNKYLGWAFIEAANFARRYDEDARRWFDRKTARTNKIIATKAMACKMAKAAWYLMTYGGHYNPERLFGIRKAPSAPS